MAGTRGRQQTKRDAALERAYPGLVQYCARIERGSAEDLAQEAMLRVLSTGRFEDIDDLGSYLRAAARNARNDGLRRRRVVEFVPEADPDAGTVDDLDVVERLAKVGALQGGLELLEDREREVFLLAAMDELSLKAIAAKVGSSEASANSLLYRARKKLRTYMEGLQRKGMLALSGPFAFFRQIAQSLTPEVIGAAAAAGAAAVAIVIGSGAANVTGRNNSPTQPQHAAVANTAALVVQRDEGRSGPGVAVGGPRPSATSPGRGDAGTQTDRPKGVLAREPDANRVLYRNDPAVPKGQTYYVGIGDNCWNGPLLRVEDDMWSNELAEVNGGQPPEELQGQAVRIEAPVNDELCDPFLVLDQQIQSGGK